MLLNFILVAFLLVFLLAFTTCMYILGLIILVRWRYRHLPTPKMKSFLLGHAMYYEEIFKKGGHFSMLISEWSKMYGPVFVVFNVHRHTIVCLEPSVVKELLINTKSNKPIQLCTIFHYVFGQRFVGTSMFAEYNHDEWEKRRKLFNVPFKRGYLIDLLYQYNGSADDLVSYLSSKADGETEILMHEEFRKLSLDVITKVAFGLNDLDAISDKVSIFSKATSDCSIGCMSQMQLTSFLAAFDFRRKSRQMQDKAKTGSMLIRDIGRRCILKRIQDIKDGKDYPKDILTHILQVSNHLQDSAFGMDDMIDEFVTFFIAGQETTASLMAFTLEHLGRNPKIYKELQDEIDAVVGNKQSIAYDDICKLEYMSLVLKEVLRISPPSVGFHRNNPRDIHINGYQIPAGSSIWLNHFAFGRDERFWDDPEKFDPERFREESSSRMYSYFPFSLGPRNCIGQHFALIEARIAITKLLQMFNFKLVPGVEFRCIAEISLKPKYKTPLYLTRRIKK